WYAAARSSVVGSGGDAGLGGRGVGPPGYVPARFGSPMRCCEVARSKPELFVDLVRRVVRRVAFVSGFGSPDGCFARFGAAEELFLVFGRAVPRRGDLAGADGGAVRWGTGW